MNKVSGINDLHNAPHILDVHNSHDLNAAPNEPDARESHDANALEQHQLPAELIRLFMQLSPQDIEQFYQSYQRWILEQRIEIQQSQIAALQQKIAQNAALMEQVRPSAIALSTLAQLQASGVEDVELLDQMLERGEAWLDRTMQQLAYCERLDLIGESYTEWCRHALEGAYDWIESIQVQEAEKTETSIATGEESGPAEAAEVTADLLLQKLMSDDDTEKMRPAQPRITAPLPTLDETTLEADDITASRVNSPTAAIIEPIAEVPATLAETVETADDTTATPIEATASLVEAAPDTITEVEAAEAPIVEQAEANTPATEQESAEPTDQATVETFEVIDPAIDQIATAVVIDKPGQEEHLDEIDTPNKQEQPEEIAVPVIPETTEDDAAPTDDEITDDLPLADEPEEAELIESAEAEEIPHHNSTAMTEGAAIEPSTDTADILANEVIVDSPPIATEVVTPAEDAATVISDTEDILTTVGTEEEQEAEAPNAPSDIEFVKDEVAALSPATEPAEEESLPSSIETNAPSDSVEIARSTQEQPPAPQPDGKPGFFKRLLAFLLS